MNVLVINCGSSSLKYQLIDSDTEAVLALASFIFNTPYQSSYIYNLYIPMAYPFPYLLSKA